MRVLKYLLAALGVLLLLASGAVGFFYWRISNPAQMNLTLPPGALSLESPEGQALLQKSTAKADYPRLKENFISQEKLSWCGPASGVMVLNALGASPRLTQEDFFSSGSEEVRSWLQVTFSGTPLSELGEMLAHHEVKATVHYASDTSLEEFRALATKNLQTEGDYLIVNFLRSTLQQEGSDGHISPLGAYDAESDRFLVLDVARYKYPPFWVKAQDLFQAMNTTDSSTGASRGFVVIQK